MKNEDFYLTVINNLSDGVYFVNLERKITFWNKAAEEITGYKAEEIVGHNCGDNLLNHIDANGRPLCVIGCPLFASMIDSKQRKEEVFLRHKEGHRIPVFVNIFPMLDAGKIVGAIEVFTPNSPIVYNDNLVEHLSNIAMRDELTALPNRRYLQSFLEYKHNEYKRFNRPFSVLFMDIDNFRAFNNEYGHDAGDAVLRAVAESIRGATRKTDMFGRWGGEEFVGVYTIRASYDTPIIAEKMRVLVANTIVPYEPPLSVTVSVGITTMRQEDTIDTLLTRADQLMYQSKEKGRNRVSAD